eukprot:gnl/TRDRNA2_/TRDRNA2_170140_c0_seq2.p1 gnl/TRDRNA2_/TRDRNA2_170140_c0~~gnl/TRDRNA2_/TRDRNA2_170140_c0_seq2.p1  ORF type:complete len:302 (+),score=53.86 gnl/TRDRNA2_/TRDRNA2_170140_c0_seq2:266-1171(+)
MTSIQQETAGHEHQKKPKKAAKKKSDETKTSVAETRRSAFAHAITSLVSQLMQGDLSLDSLEEAPPSSYNDMRDRLMGADQKKKEMEVCVSDQQTYQRLLEMQQAQDVETEGLLSSALRGSAVDDTLSVLASDDYVEVRLRPMLARFKIMAPYLRSYYYTFQSCIFLLTTLCALLSVLGEAIEETNEVGSLAPSLWIPVVVATITSLTAIADYEQFGPRLKAVNTAIQTLESVLLWWASLSLVEKRLPECREHLVSSVEAVDGADNIWVTAFSSMGGEVGPDKEKAKGGDKDDSDEEAEGG